MGGFTPAAILGLVEFGLNSAQRAEQARTAQAAQVELANVQARQIEQARQAESEQRARALRQAAAAQRARFGASGVGLDGSAASVLSGLAVEAAEQEQAASDRAQLQIDRLNTRVASQGRRNLLAVNQPLVQGGLDAIRRNLNRTSLLP